MLWNRKYQEFDLVVSSVSTKVKGVTQTHLPGLGDVVWDVADYSGSLQVGPPRDDHLSVREVILKMVVVFFLGQKLFFCDDQRHRHSQSEAGKVSRGALSLLLSIFILLSLSLCCRSWLG